MDFNTLLESIGKPYYRDPTADIAIYCGDCREILPKIPDKSMGLVVTSPPYNLYKQWWDSGIRGLAGHKELMRKFTDEWYTDSMPEAEYQTQEEYLIGLALNKSVGSVCYNHKVRYAHKRAGRAFHPAEWLPMEKLWVEIIWDRGGGVTFNSRRPVIADERIFVLGRPKAWHNDHSTNIWHFNPDSECKEFPCAFPVELPSRCIELFSDPGDVILDYYSGSGTTAVAAKKAGRKAIGIEICQAYCDIAIKRLAQSVMRFEEMTNG